MAAVLTCANHPRVETRLRCGKCEKPICAACAIQTPVGLRCRECAQLRRLPTYDVSPWQYLQAAGTALGLGLVLGLGWTLLRGFPVFGFYLSFIIALAIGYVMGEAVSLAANHKRGRGLQVVAALGVFLSYLVSRLPLLALVGVPSLAVPGIMGAFLDPFGLLAVAIGIYLAASRIR